MSYVVFSFSAFPFEVFAVIYSPMPPTFSYNSHHFLINSICFLNHLLLNVSMFYLLSLCRCFTYSVCVDALPTQFVAMLYLLSLCRCFTYSVCGDALPTQFMSMLYLPVYVDVLPTSLWRCFTYQFVVMLYLPVHVDALPTSLCRCFTYQFMSGEQGISLSMESRALV